MVIRTAGLADADTIAQLHTRSWQSAYRGILSDDFLQGPLPENRRVLWRTRLSDADRSDQCVLLDEQDGALRGFACAFLGADPEWGCLLDNLHVVPDLKGKGVGKQLMGAVALRVLSSNPQGRLHLWAFEQNLGARRFYERLGGVVNERIAEVAPDGSEMNVVRYCWSDLSALAEHC
jgi:GNAT superfamily N-acetyltransferase